VEKETLSSMLMLFLSIQVKKVGTRVVKLPKQSNPHLLKLCVRTRPSVFSIHRTFP